MRFWSIVAVVTARLLRAPEAEAPSTAVPACELPAELKNQTIGWSLLQVNEPHVILLGEGLEGEEGTANLMLYDCKKQKRLLFLHIPKNAGSTIENVAMSSGVAWGKHMDHGGQKMPDGNTCSKWHVPPAYLPNPNPYNDAEIFCVTRNPYDRALSEYRYLLDVKWGWDNPRLRKAPQCTDQGVNTFLLESLRMVQSGQTFLNDCHFVPQSMFIWGPQKQLCTNILRIDSLTTSFNALMKQKGYSVTLGAEKKNSKKDVCPGLSTANFWPQTRQLLDTVYAQDFQKLHYTSPPR